MLKSHELGVAMQVTKGGGGGSFHREERFSLMYCETLLQVLLGIYYKRFYWRPLFTILLLLYVFEIGKAKSATQSVLMLMKH